MSWSGLQRLPMDEVPIPPTKENPTTFWKTGTIFCVPLIPRGLVVGMILQARYKDNAHKLVILGNTQDCGPGVAWTMTVSPQRPFVATISNQAKILIDPERGVLLQDDDPEGS